MSYLEQTDPGEPRRPRQATPWSKEVHPRREFLRRIGLGVAALAAGATEPAGAGDSAAARNPLPRWRGFNLINFFQALSRGESGSGRIREEDLKWIRDWGFDFVRLPMDYWMWIDSDWRRTRSLRPEDVFRIKESALEGVDDAVEKCRRYGLHCSLNFHRAPGYCINNPQREPFVLWKDKAAQDAFIYHWELFAKRYRGVPSKALSFNLLNEAPTPRPGYMSEEDYVRIMNRAIQAIRKISPERIILVDGLNVGTKVVEGLVPTKAAQSVHAYWPAQISHYRAPWVDRRGTFPKPSWPLRDKRGRIIADRAALERRYAPWGALARRGVGVHCGECGCYNKTPYPVFIAWFRDVMEVLKERQIGYALWNFRGSFGVLDSGRTDIAYEDWRGHKLDRRLLKLLQEF